MTNALLTAAAIENRKISAAVFKTLVAVISSFASAKRNPPVIGGIIFFTLS